MTRQHQQRFAMCRVDKHIWYIGYAGQFALCLTLLLLLFTACLLVFSTFLNGYYSNLTSAISPFFSVVVVLFFISGESLMRCALVRRILRFCAFFFLCLNHLRNFNGSACNKCIDDCLFFLSFHFPFFF